MKGPDPVKDIIRRGGNAESKCIGDVFLNFQDLLTKKGDPKIHHDAGESHQTKFDELQKKNLGKE